MSTLPSSHLVDPLSRSAKEVAQGILDKLPDDCTLDQIDYHLRVAALIHRRLQEAERGDFLTHDQVKERLAKWLQK